jgi:hypothetical protein
MIKGNEVKVNEVANEIMPKLYGHTVKKYGLEK